MDRNEPRAEGSTFKAAGEGKQASLVGEFYAFVKANKKFWLIPLLIALLLLGLIIVLGGTAAAPFIYTLF